MVGRHVVTVANARGHEVVPLARAVRVDLRSSDGLADRLAGVHAVIDTSGTRTQRRATARRFFGDVTRHLLEAGTAAGVAHHGALSIVGVDRVDTGYYAGKLDQERLVAIGPVPWSILRSTQFHEFAQQALGFVAVGPVSLVPRMRIQPVAAREVAEALVGLVEEGPSGRLTELAGPEVHQLVDLCRRLVDARGVRPKVVGVALPGAVGRAMRDGALLPVADGPRGVVTFEDWLVRER